MKDQLIIVIAFLIVVGLAMYMYASNQKHSISITETKKLEEILNKKNEDLQNKINELKNHVHLMDSLYHNK